MADDTPLAIACGVVGAISLLLQVACLFAQDSFKPPSHQVRVFSLHSGSFVTLNCVQFIFTVVLLGVSASLISGHAPGSALPVAIEYSIFPAIASALTLISFSFAQISVTFRRPGHIWTLNILNIIFSLCAVLALSIKLGALKCVDAAAMSTNPILGSYAPDDRPSACQRTQAAIAFYSFLLASYIVTLAMVMTMDSEPESVRSSGRTIALRSSNASYDEEVVRRPPTAAGRQGNEITQHFQNTRVINFFPSGGRAITQHYHDSQAVNIAAENETTAALALQGMMSPHLIQK